MTGDRDLDALIRDLEAELEPRRSTNDGDYVPKKAPMNSDHVRVLHPAADRSSMRKRQMTLTEQERQALLAEIAEIAAELDAMQERTAEIVARVTRGSCVRLARPA